jgi:predicted nucleic acid-binding protein
MVIYLDNCALNRPFDDITQPRVWLEALTMVLILDMVLDGRLKLVRSEMHDLENERTPDPTRQSFVAACLALAADFVTLDDMTKARAIDLQASGLKAMDAFHLALAESGKVECFVTTDDRIVNRYTGPMRVLHPTSFVVAFVTPP